MVSCCIHTLSVQVDNTDAEGRLILADTLCYSRSFKPAAVLDVATLTGAVDVALGAGAAAVFTNSSKLWEQLHEVSYHIEIVSLMTLMALFLSNHCRVEKAQVIVSGECLSSISTPSS